MAQLATVDQQRELMRYMRGLNQWLERDVHDRHAELRHVESRVNELQGMIGSLLRRFTLHTHFYIPLTLPKVEMESIRLIQRLSHRRVRLQRRLSLSGLVSSFHLLPAVPLASNRIICIHISKEYLCQTPLSSRGRLSALALRLHTDRDLVTNTLSTRLKWVLCRL